MAALPRVCPYHVLGLPSTADRQQVKEEFRKLCLQFHPDKCAPDIPKAAAEARFREIKGAYDAILRGHAGYSPPPPGSAPNAAHAQEWYRAHHYGSEAGGPVRCGGPYGGFANEMDFYKSMFRKTRNNPFFLIMAGLVSIPFVSAAVSVANGKTSFIQQYKEQGIFMFTQNRFKINGRETVHINPFSIRAAGGDSMQDSYIYKNEKYKHLRTGAFAPKAVPSEGGSTAAPAQ
uniref:J domain-containing protein n=1 Tax=Chlamydomonas leiostraca TaxID=1034604 RepID=A0A7S0WRH3_9CHLO|mmetsp:Transcript_25155/g.63829  ORF Transcript_25155/g.63829 Transcript_25155/m.63829 type:complete len:232 (+) Transcript_25155:138-833(+)